MMQQMMQQMFSDPQMMETIANSNPMLRQLMDTNPHVRAMLQNPQFLRQVSDPENLAAMLQMQAGMAQLQRGGLVPGPPPGAGAAGAGAAGGTQSGANPWAGLTGPAAPDAAGRLPPALPFGMLFPPITPSAPAPRLDPMVQNLDFS